MSVLCHLELVAYFVIRYSGFVIACGYSDFGFSYAHNGWAGLIRPSKMAIGMDV